MLTPTANFVSRHLQLCSSLGYVLYITPLLLPRIHCGQATSAAGSEADVLLSRRVPIFGEHRFEAHSISFSWFFGISSLRKWKPAAPERHWDMCINGSDIRFIDRKLPEMKYMFHACPWWDSGPSYSLRHSGKAPKALIYVSCSPIVGWTWDGIVTPNFAHAIIPSEHAVSEFDTVYRQLCW